MRFGGILSFFVVTLADRYGRKPVIANTVLCYAFFTLLTALSSGMLSFTLFQSASQLFLAAEFGIAVTIICEEFPDELRGRAISILHMVAFVGVAAAGLLYGYVAESSWGWRGMYFLGIAPLLVVAWLRRGMRETDPVRRVRSGGARLPEAREGSSLRCGDASSRAGLLRGRLLLIASLCNCIGLVGGPTISFFSLYAKRDHHWTSGQIGAAIVLAYLMGSDRHAALRIAARSDRAARDAALFFLGSAFAMF